MTDSGLCIKHGHMRNFINPVIANAAENTRDQKTAKASVANLYKQPDSSFQYGAPLTLTEEDMQLQLALELSRQEIVRAQNNLSVNDLHLTDEVKHNDIKSWIAQQQILSTKVPYMSSFKPEDCNQLSSVKPGDERLCNSISNLKSCDAGKLDSRQQFTLPKQYFRQQNEAMGKKCDNAVSEHRREYSQSADPWFEQRYKEDIKRALKEADENNDLEGPPRWIQVSKEHVSPNPAYFEFLKEREAKAANTRKIVAEMQWLTHSASKPSNCDTTFVSQLTSSNAWPPVNEVTQFNHNAYSTLPALDSLHIKNQAEQPATSFDSTHKQLECVNKQSASMVANCEVTVEKNVQDEDLMHEFDKLTDRHLSDAPSHQKVPGGNAKKKPEDFLGEYSSLVNFDNLVARRPGFGNNETFNQPKMLATNPFTEGLYITVDEILSSAATLNKNIQNCTSQLSSSADRKPTTKHIGNQTFNNTNPFL